MASGVGIDLGTSSVLVYVEGQGVVLKEPSVVAYDKDTNEIKAIGEEARNMLGRTPGSIVAVKPLRKGVISDYTVTEKMLKYFIQKSLGRRTFRKPDVCICVPGTCTEVERKAVEEAAYGAGARDVVLIEEPVASAIGAGIDISKPAGNFIVDIGGGTSDIAVISMGGIVVANSLKVAGDDFDEAILRMMRREHDILIGDQMAEKIKINTGSVYPKGESKVVQIRGRNLVSGMPSTVNITTDEVSEALKEPAWKILEAIVDVLEKTPPELAADILERGIILTGGGSLLNGLDELIEERTAIRTVRANDPMTCVALGTGRYIEFVASNDDYSLL